MAFAVFEVLFSFERIGFFSLMKDNERGRTAKELAETLSVDQRTLSTLCDFLTVNVPEVLLKKDDTYYLTTAFLNKHWQNLLHFALAYRPVLENIEGLLKGDVIYGQDIVRDGQYLRISSALYNQPSWELIINQLATLGIATVVDCGCSGGDFLVRACKALPNLSGVGIDNDTEVIKLAIASVPSMLQDRIFIQEGDVSKLDDWCQAIPSDVAPDRLAFVGVTVWHEFLRSGDTGLTDIFLRYRSLFPGSFFIIAEYNAFSWSELPLQAESLREAASVYQLVHPLTGQGMPQSPEWWQTTLSKAGIKIENIIPVNTNSTVYVGRL